MQEYNFTPESIPILHKYNAKELLKGKKEISLDLGISKEKVEITKEAFFIRGIKVEKRIIEKIAKDKQNNIFFVFPDGVKKALFFDKAVYKLRLVAPDTAPTLEINGIHMHRIKGITPLEDAKSKIKAINIKPGDKVLDICTGLGYTAIYAWKASKTEVITVEKDKNVLELAELNPWSKELERKEIKIYLADAEEFIKELKDESFTAIIHDPPREALARKLYSRGFYRELYRVLVKEGRLLHYVGEPKKRAMNFLLATAKRLEEVGFKTEILKHIKCVLAKKV